MARGVSRLADQPRGATVPPEQRHDLDDYDDFDRGTPAEIVARICTELGVEFDAGIWGRWRRLGKMVRLVPEGETSPASLRGYQRKCEGR